MAETVKSIAEKLAKGSMSATEAGLKIRDVVNRVPWQKTEKDYYEGHHELAIDLDPNSFIHITSLYNNGVISDADLKAIYAAMEGKTSLSGKVEYYLTANSEAVRKVDGEVEVFSAGGWVEADDAGALSPCTEQEALDAAKKVMGH